MDTQNPQRYPIGTQTFSILREDGLVYVDKTDLVYDMTHGDSRYIFLSRPRRFGKTLLVTTLKAYFEGKKELFEGLAIEKLETEWTKYPVLHFSMSQGRDMDEKLLEEYLMSLIDDCEMEYGVKAEGSATNIRLRKLVKLVSEKTGQKVVVLVDEYDTPLLDVLHEDEELPKLRNVMRNFYSPLKDLDPYLRFVFLTGITKFSQLSIFSELNNIRNISMNPKYATICGITEEEMLTQLRPGIEHLAENKGLTYDGAVARLKQTYDGYHFCWPSPDIYNPYSLLNALSDSEITNYWFGTATPSYLVEMLRKFKVTAVNIGGQRTTASGFDAPTEYMTSIVPLLYQSGYTTIKGYDQRTKKYLLDIPNREVRVGLMDSLLPEYVKPAREEEARNVAEQIYFDVVDGKIEECLELIKKFLSSMPYTKNTKYEGHYQSLLYAIFSLVGEYDDIDVEPRASRGDIDMIIRTDTTIYIFEVKMDKGAKVALEQIDVKSYPDRFAFYTLPIVKIGINFSSKTRTIDEWVIER